VLDDAASFSGQQSASPDARCPRTTARSGRWGRGSTHGLASGASPRGSSIH